MKVTSVLLMAWAKSEAVMFAARNQRWRWKEWEKELPPEAVSAGESARLLPSAFALKAAVWWLVDASPQAGRAVALMRSQPERKP